MRINHNIAALNTYRQLGQANNAQQNSMEKLSSGLRINKAGDDAAGLAISEKMRGQIRGLDQAQRNSQDGISLIQTAEGALNETHSILQRMRELSVQAANDTNTEVDRQSIQDEVTQLGKEIDRIANTTEFNTKNLLDGSMSEATTATTGTIVNDSQLNASVVTATTLGNLTDGDGNNLGLADGDVITATWSINGTQVTEDYTITTASSETMGNILSDLDTEASIGTATIAAGDITLAANGTGAANQINGFSIEVKSSAGDRKEAASDALSNFEVGTEAEDTSTDGSATFQIGANDGQELNLSINDMRASTLGVADLQVGTQSQASTAIKAIDEALAEVSTERGKLGAYQNRLDHTINNLGTSSENLTAAESRIRDVDMAKEMMNQTKSSILSQASQAMLAKANQNPQGVLQLLR
ncbi:flagellin N-terminal helical domain-containing protein [Halobacillus salinus]|uniref:flagellin N-terminal helical domain-containing protein n=1 Tax=Halobacillus salinus TaxID=192814 RepID=UPI0009A6BA24|nr:flagellin [Halobacillus salinus]